MIDDAEHTFVLKKKKEEKIKMKARPIRVAQCMVAKIWIQHRRDVASPRIRRQNVCIYHAVILLVTKNVGRRQKEGEGD